MQHFRRRTTHVRSQAACRAAVARCARLRTVRVAAATALASLLLPIRHGSAQTWAAPVSGSWSVAGNWLGGAVPVSASTTDLRFDASAADSYTAFNDLANPFVLNEIDLNNTGSGAITLDGSPLNFSGTAPSISVLSSGSSIIRNGLQLSTDTSIVGTGSGTISLQGAITAIPASTRSLVADLSNGNVVLTGGATLYGLKVNSGNVVLSAGTYTLASAQHGTDPFGNVSDGGFWSMVAGDSAGQTGRLTLSNGAVLNAQNGFVANAANTAGIATFTGAGTTANFPTTGTEGRFGVNFGTGTVNVLAGATVNSRRADIGRQSNSNGYLLVDGGNSRVNVSQSFNVPTGSNATGTALISNGGQVALTGGFAFIAGATDSLGASIPSTGAVTISGAGSSLSVGSLGGGNNGQLAVGIGSTSVAAAGTLNITAGGSASARNTFVGRELGVGTVLIDGSSSRLVTSNQISVSSAAATSSSITVANGGTLSSGNNFFAGVATFDTGMVTVTGPASLATIAGATVLGGGNGIGSFGGSATLNIAAGGEWRTDFLQAAENPNGRAVISADGSDSKLTVTDQLIVGDDVGANGTITVSNGATATVTSAAFLAPALNSRGTVTITGAGSSFASGGSLTELQIGGAFGAAGGTATFNVLNNAVATANRLAVVYLRSALNVGSGSTPARFTAGSGGLIVDGTVNYNSGTLNTTGTLSVGGNVLLSSAGPGRANKKTLDVGTVSLTASGIVDLNDNDMISRGSSKAAIQNSINGARHNGAWDLPGITSSAARDNAQHNTTLGVLSGSEYTSVNGGTTQFNGRTFAGSDVLVKYTYYGDTDFNGKVNFDDYVRIDNGFNNHLTGWLNGDFDGNGNVNFDDYVLIDLAFNTQGATLARGSEEPGSAGLLDRAITQAVLGQSVAEEKQLIAHAQPIGGDRLSGVEQARGAATRAVPEPATSGMWSVGLLVGTCVPRVRRRCVFSRAGDLARGA
jgi:T5SS/PEP-CTERM-associated repeat protein